MYRTQCVLEKTILQNNDNIKFLTRPYIISYKTAPRHHQSTVLSYSCFLRTSGAKYCKEEKIEKCNLAVLEVQG